MTLIYTPELIPLTLTGDLKRGGWTLTGRVGGDTDAVAYGENWRLMAKSGSDWYDADWREAFNGHVIASPDPLQFDRYASQAQINAGTMDALLSGEALQDIGFTSQATPANDHQITDMTLADIVEHILRRHCNAVYDATTMPDGVITETDIDTTNSVPLERYNVSKSANMWRSMQAIGGGETAGEFYRCWFDRHNKFYYQPAPAFWSSPPTSLGTLTKSHLRGSVRVKLNNNQPAQRIGQVAITAIKDFDTVFTATYPTNAEAGKILPPRDGIFANDQTKTNTLAERLYKWLTRDYTLQVEIDPGLLLFGDDGNGLDLANKIAITYDGPAEDTASGAGVHLNLSAEPFFVYGAQVTFDVAGRMARAVLTLEQDPT